MITLAITSYNRPEMTAKSFQKVIDHPSIGEILIVDDCSKYRYVPKKHIDKLRIEVNPKNIGCYHNKKRAIELSSHDWVILLDSDNVIDKSYIDSLISESPFYWDTIYAPEYARPHFDYRKFSGQKITRNNVGSMVSQKGFDCLINTCNYFVNRSYYLDSWKDHKEPWTADTLFHNYNHLKSGGKIKIVKGMQYDHLVHEGSHYQQNISKTGGMREEYMNKLQKL